MVATGRCVQDVNENGLVSLSQLAQYCALGRTLTFTVTPICFHMSAIATTAFASQSGSSIQLISVAKPSGTPASASSFFAASTSCVKGGILAYSGWTGAT